MTTDRSQEWSRRSPALYPRFSKSTADLRSPSICLLDQVRARGAEQVRGYRGTLGADPDELRTEGERSSGAWGTRLRDAQIRGPYRLPLGRPPKAPSPAFAQPLEIRTETW